MRVKRKRETDGIFYNQKTLPDSSFIVALSCNLVPIGTAWSTGISFCMSTVSPSPPSADLGVASRYNATSYSKVPGDSCTTPETLAAGGLEKKIKHIYQITSN